MAPRREGILFTGGDGPPRVFVEEALRNAAMIIAADSGWDLARSMGANPEMVLGDMDSIRDTQGLRELPPERILSFDSEKDETDTEIGLRYLHEHGFPEVTLIGGGGGRLDHLIGILSLFDREIRPRRWLTERDEVLSIDGSLTLTGMLGKPCSFFPAGPDPCTMRTTGLRWPLDHLRWTHGDVGISNYGIQDTVSIEMLGGRLIMVRALTEVRGG